MPDAKLLKPKGAHLTTCPAGISYRIPGVNRNPSSGEKNHFQGFLEFMESRNAL